MAWNLPGRDSNNDKPKRNKGSGGNPFSGLFNRLQGGDPAGIGRWVGIAVVLALLMSSVVLVTEQQRGVVVRFGQYVRTMQPGPNLKLPWPFERVTKVNATAINTYSESVPILTRDENIVTVEINVQYRISNPERYVFGTRDAVDMLKQAALSAVREQVGHSDLDTVLGARNALAVTSRANLQRSLDAYRTGLVVTELNLPNARPPEEVKPAFDDVNSAQQDKDRLISEARAYAAKVVPEARGAAARTRTIAEGYKTTEIARASGDADRFNALVTQYKVAPEATRTRMWLETMQGVLANNRKVVGADSKQILNFSLPTAAAPSDAPTHTTAPAAVVASEPTSTETIRPARQGRTLDRGETGR